MFVLLELAGLAVLASLVWVLFRASRARPEDSGLRTVARLGLAAWVVFAIWTLGAFDTDWSDLTSHAGTLGLLLLLAVAIAGYVWLIGHLRHRGGR